MKPKLLLDMDGVLADFATGALAACDLPSDHSIFAKDYYVGLGKEEFWARINAKGFHFWASLSKTKEADYLVSLAISEFGKDNIGIATSPSFSNLSDCVRGKRYWMEEQYPALAENMIFVNNKSLLASPQHLLVDDQEKVTQAFTKAGGSVILVPRVWNSRAGEDVVKAAQFGIAQFKSKLDYYATV